MFRNCKITDVEIVGDSNLKLSFEGTSDLTGIDFKCNMNNLFVDFGNATQNMGMITIPCDTYFDANSNIAEFEAK